MCIVSAHGTEADSLSTNKKKAYHGPMIQRFSVEMRMGWQLDRINGETNKELTGFKAEHIKMYLFARLYKRLSFQWRQRLNITDSRTFWDCTDYIQLVWDINPRWQVSAGKQVVAIGGYEYDRPFIDLYNNSEFWNNIPGFQLGASVAYTFKSGDCLTFQLNKSPFSEATGDNNAIGFSLMWKGKHGMWESLWSANAFQTGGGRWINYISLGNKFNFLPNDRLWLELDFMNRASSGQAFFFKDCSVIAELSGRPHTSVRTFAKYTYDVNHSGTDADLCVLDGTEMHGISGGVEYHPIKPYPNLLRLFATAGYSTGTQGNPDGTLQDGLLHVKVGFKVNLDILQGLRWALKKQH